MTALHAGPVAAQSVAGAVERLGALIDAALAWASAHATVLAVLGVGIAAITDVLRWWVRRRRHARMLRGAVTVAVMPPPRVDPDGALVFWSNLLGLLRPALVRGVRGQPHLVFEYAFTPDGVTVSVWVPGGIAAGLVARAVTAAWPGSRTTLTPTPTTPQRTHGEGGQAGRPRAAGPRWWRVGSCGWPAARRCPWTPARRGWTRSGRCWPRPAPLRAGEWVRVQVLARPVSSARLARLARTATGRRRPDRRGGRDPAAGDDPRAAGRDHARPGPARHLATVAGYGWWPPRARMLEIAQDRAAVGKARGGGYETLIRYATATPDPTPVPRSRTAHRPGLSTQVRCR